MFTKVVCLLALAGVVMAGHHAQGGQSSVSREQDHHGYRYRYDVDNHGSRQGQQESGDHSGARRGSYYVDLPHAHSRVQVEYADDGHGLRGSLREQNPWLNRYTDNHRDNYDLRIHHEAPRHHYQPVHHVPVVQHHHQGLY